MTVAAEISASLNRIAAIIGKEFVTLFIDKASRIILIIPVILQSLLFGYGATFNLERVPWSYFDASRGSASTEVIRRIEGTGIFSLQTSPRSLDALVRSVDDGDALLGLYFPPDFERRGECFVAADARNSTTAGIASGYLTSILARINAERGAAPPVTLIERYRFNENGLTRYAIVPSLIVVLSMLQVLLLSGFSVAREREEGAFDMMLMTPANSIEILIGKAVIPAVVACLQALAIFLVGVFWFELPFAGSWLTLGVFIFGFVLSFVGMGLAVSALADNIQQAVVMAIFIMLPTVVLSGLFTSVRAMPEWMQTLTLLNPLRHAVTALRAIYFENASLADLGGHLAVIAAAGVASLSWAAWLFRHKIQ